MHVNLLDRFLPATYRSVCPTCGGRVKFYIRTSVDFMKVSDTPALAGCHRTFSSQHALHMWCMLGTVWSLLPARADLELLCLHESHCALLFSPPPPILGTSHRVKINDMNILRAVQEWVFAAHMLLHWRQGYGYSAISIGPGELFL